MKSEIIREIDIAFRDSREDSINFISYTGHGHYDPKLNMSYLAGVDGGLISVPELSTILSMYKGKFFIVLDSCYSGGFINPDIGMKATRWGSESLSSFKHLEEEKEYDLNLDLISWSMVEPFTGIPRSSLTEDRFYVIASANTSESSYELNFGAEWGWGGELTRAVALGNGYKGDFKADFNLDGKVFFKELAEFSKNSVRKSRVNYTSNAEDLLVGRMGVNNTSIRYKVPVNKEWKIVFNMPVDEEDAKDKIYIEDFHKSIDTRLRFDGSAVYARANGLLEENRYYRLRVPEGLKAANSNAKSLSKDESVHFYTELNGRREESLRIVRDGYLEGHPQKTVGEAFSDKYFNNPGFFYKIGTIYGDHVVFFEGEILLNGQTVLLEAIFPVDLPEGTFVLNSIGYDGHALTEEEFSSLMGYLYGGSL